jgi:prolyl-tRNA editing enzyme YbaK/EbsC (Cys-tRNA(Pro) deacylase)
MSVITPLDRVREHVQKFDTNLEPIVYEEALKTSDEAAQALGVDVAQIAKSILFRSNDAYGLFVAAGDIRIHPKQVKKCLGGKQVTGFQVGAVCPFALLQEVPIFIDESLQRFDTVYTAAGIPESLLPVSYSKLLDMTKGVSINAAAPE